jgi:L-lactate dehydrogenase complex protein LldF
VVCPNAPCIWLKSWITTRGRIDFLFMANAFHEKIQASLSNTNLQVALDNNAERRLKARLQSYTSLPQDLQTLRQRAHAVRAETIAHLNQYLAAFESRLQANGVIVHHARDAAHATEIVLGIARQKNAHLVAKSKTMLGEEININHILEAAGMRVVETDLGEYIVQLRGERPAHIITPAVHLRRQDVGQTFHEKLGIPFTEDVPTLTAAAHRVLRQTFLDADIGISGVNFGVAETGTICLVTNEGNGRMVTTLPAVHVALMGIERLVPSLDDLALMLLLLARSSSGQKLTVYTSLIQTPRRAQDSDGPLERHLILVDNGRMALRNTPLEESLYCIRCGACLNICPVFGELGGHAYVGAQGQETPYPGPIGSVLSPGLFGVADFGNLARASSLCGACKEVCPVDIDLPRMLLRVRAGKLNPVGALPSAGVIQPATPLQKRQSVERHASLPLRWGLRLYSWAAASPGRFALAQRLFAWFAHVLAPRSSWLCLPALTGWGYSRDFPRPAVKSFHARWPDLAQAAPPSGSNLPTFERSNVLTETLPADSRPNASNLLERFSRELINLGGEVTCCAPAELAEQVLTFLQSNQVQRLLAWQAPYLPPNLLESLVRAGIQIVHQPDPQAQAGLTGALAGLAETGSLVLPSGPGRPATASLLPEIHLVILHCEDILPNLEGLLAGVYAGKLQTVLEASSLAVISGPSRTADIEMTLTIGVHGPRRVHVFCVEGLDQSGG